MFREPEKKLTAKRARAPKPKVADLAAGGDIVTDEKPAKAPRQFKAFVPTGPVYDESMRPPKTTLPATRLISWNVAGLRAILRKVSWEAFGVDL